MRVIARLKSKKKIYFVWLGTCLFMQTHGVKPQISMGWCKGAGLGFALRQLGRHRYRTFVHSNLVYGFMHIPSPVVQTDVRIR